MCRIFASRYSSHSLTIRNVQAAGGGEGRGLIPKHPVIHEPSRDHFGTYSDTVEFMAEAMNVSRYMVWNGCYHLGLVYIKKGEHPCALPTARRIRRHIFTIGLWQLPERGAECRASSAGPVVLDPGVRARALRPHRQLRRVGLLLDPAELRGRGTGLRQQLLAPQR
jgi:hypothetical protein